MAKNKIEPIIKIENLGKKYMIGAKERYYSLRDSFTNIFKKKQSKKEFWALKNINLEIKKGEILGIIGTNGSGKSTLLKVISRITPPTTGRVGIKGKVAALLEIGTGFHQELTGRENIFLSAAILGMSRTEITEKFDQIVEFSEISQFLDTPVKRYSSGMYVRLAFSIAAHLDPDILIIDEVLAVGDINFQKKCLGRMSEIGQSDRTVLFVSHNMMAVKSLCGRAIWLDKGKIIMDGKAEEVVDQYIGNIGKNVFHRKWSNTCEAPQNANMIIEGIRLVDCKGETLKYLDIDTAFNVEIEYKIKKDRSHAGFNLMFFNKDNTCLLCNLNNFEKEWYGKPMTTGKYKSICKIPGQFFNNRFFNLSLAFFNKGFSDFVRFDNILKFEFGDGVVVRGDYLGEYDGLLRPKFEWETKKQ